MDAQWLNLVEELEDEHCVVAALHREGATFEDELTDWDITSWLGVLGPDVRKPEGFRGMLTRVDLILRSEFLHHTCPHTRGVQRKWK